MSPLKYLVLAALGLGALAIDSGTADASPLNTTATWCKARTTTDQVLVEDGFASLRWTPDGDVVLQPTNHFVPKIWSSGTGGAGDKVCWEDTGTLAIYDAAGAKLWSRSGGTVPDPSPGINYQAKVDLSLTNCDLLARYSSRAQVLFGGGWSPWHVYASRELWTPAPTCPVPTQGLVADDWCLDAPAAGHELTILQSSVSELVWTPDGILVQRGTGIAAGREVWRSDNGPAGKQICFAPTGELTIFDELHNPVWTTPADTSTTSSHLLALDDCDLGVRRADGVSLWKDAHRCPQTTMSMGVQWTAGANDIVLLENDQARLVFQADGNLVLRSAQGDEVWHSGLSANVGKRLAFQTDGNLVIYTAASGGAAAWGAKAWGQGITRLELDGCMFSLKTPTETRWSRGGATCPSDTLTNSWTSSNSGVSTLLRTPEARLVWQTNGSLVLRTTSGATVWSSGTGGSGSRDLSFQSDGNLVIYDASRTALWSTNTWKTTSVSRRLRLADHCKLTLEDMSGTVLWTGNDSCTVMNYSFEREDGDSKFGAALYTHLTAKDDGTARVDSATGIDVTILGTSIELFSATAYQTETNDGSRLNTASVEIFGISNPGANVSYEQTFFEESKTYMVGPVPVFVSVGASGELGLSLAFGGGAGLTLTPTAGIYATAEAGVGGECDLGGASAGIRGQLTLIEVGLPITLNLYIDGGQPRYSVKGDLTLTSLSGLLELYAEAYVKICFVKVSADWTYGLFSWTGVEWSKNLFNQSGTF